MDKTIEEWQKRFRGMKPEQIQNAWASKSSDTLSWREECNFHAAAAERMKQLGNMAIDLDDDVREKLCRQANSILEKLSAHLEEDAEKLQAIAEVAEKSDAYYQKFGTRTARYYMFEQGIIDALGDRKKFG